MHPLKGEGIAETIIAIFFIVGLFVTIAMGNDIPDVVTATIGAIVGFFFGARAVKNS